MLPVSFFILILKHLICIILWIFILYHFSSSFFFFKCIVFFPASRQKFLDSTQWKNFSFYKNYRAAQALMTKAHDQKSCRKNTPINDSQTTTTNHLQSYIYTMNRMNLMTFFSIFFFMGLSLIYREFPQIYYKWGRNLMNIIFRLWCYWKCCLQNTCSCLHQMLLKDSIRT